jgi:hypothetical protein
MAVQKSILQEDDVTPVFIDRYGTDFAVSRVTHLLLICNETI